MTIGENIKKYRKMKKITQKQLSDLINKGIRTLQKYENGDITPPIKVLNDIAWALQVPIKNIIGNDNNIVYEEFPDGYRIIDKTALFTQVITNKDLCNKLNIRVEDIRNFLNPDENITKKSLQALCEYLELVQDEEAFLYSMYVYKTDNDLFRIVIFYYYLKDEYGIELNYPNEEFLSIGDKLNEEFKLNLSLGFALGDCSKSIVVEIIENTREDRNVYKNIIDELSSLDKTYSFSYDELSLEDSYNICTKLTETLKYELYKTLKDKKYNFSFHEKTRNIDNKEDK